MIRSRRRRNALLTLLLGIQGLGIVVPLADAQLEAASAVVDLGESGDDSSRGHAHDDCALCQHLAHRHATVLGAVALLPPAPVSRHPSLDAEIGVDGRAAPTRRGRSPPFD